MQTLCHGTKRPRKMNNRPMADRSAATRDRSPEPFRAFRRGFVQPQGGPHKLSLLYSQPLVGGHVWSCDCLSPGRSRFPNG
jgi:hypothetical protein